MFEGSSLMDQYSNSGSQSIFDSRNSDHSTNNMFGGQSVFSEINKRSSNHNNTNIIDRMRGIQGSKFDLSEDVSLAEQYNDQSLDKRTFGGSYQITISDIYKDKALMKDHFNLYTDSMVKEKESIQYETQREKFLDDKVGVSDLSDFSKKSEFKKESLDNSTSTNRGAASYEPKSFRDTKTFRDSDSNSNSDSNDNSIYLSEDSNELNINGGSTGLYATKYDPSIYEKNSAKEESEEEKRKKRNQRKNNKQNVETSLHGGQGLYGIKKKEKEIKSPKNLLEIKDSERPHLNAEALMKSKELQLNSENKQDFKSSDIGNNHIYAEMSYSDLNNLCSNYELEIESSTDVRKGIISKEISIIKPILIKKAIYNDF